MRGRSSVRLSRNRLDDMRRRGIVTDTISWRCHHDRIMQLNRLYLCGICQMMPLNVWPHIYSSRLQPSIKLHAPVTTIMLSCCSGTYVLSRRNESLSKPCAECSDRNLIVYWRPLRMRDRAAGFEIISGDHCCNTNTTQNYNCCQIYGKLCTGKTTRYCAMRLQRITGVRKTSHVNKTTYTCKRKCITEDINTVAAMQCCYCLKTVTLLVNICQFLFEHSRIF